MERTFIGTTLYLVIMLGVGYALKKAKLIRENDGTLSNYVIYVAMPSLVLKNMMELSLDWMLLRTLTVCLLSMATLSSLVYLAGRVMRRERSEVYLMILAANFGNTGFFGIPFISITFNEPKALQLSVILWMVTFVISSLLCILLLESLRARGSPGGAFIGTLRNPLVASLAVGVLMNLTGLRIPSQLASVLESLGNTASPLALISVGASLSASASTSLPKQGVLLALRAFLSPAISLLLGSLVGLSPMELSVLVLMSAMPAAVLLGVFSNAYDFQRDVIPQFITISSLAAPIYLNIWLHFLTLSLAH
ncbi:MAG: AEC family transporter [Candidatus Korarchaeum sp.]